MLRRKSSGCFHDGPRGLGFPALCGDPLVVVINQQFASSGSANFRLWLRLLKKSSEGTRHEISCPLSGIAHHRHEGTGRHTQNPVLTARRALETASGVVPPLQNKSGEFSRHLIADFFNSLGYKQTFSRPKSKSASPPTTDIPWPMLDFR